MTSVAEAVAVLNRIHETDPFVLPALVRHRVTSCKALGDDPTVQCGPEPDNEVGLLGIINGIFGVDGNGYGHIGAVYNEGQLLFFEDLSAQ